MSDVEYTHGVEVGVHWIARECGVSQNTVTRWVRDGKIPNAKSTAAGYRFPRAWANDWTERKRLELERESLRWGRHHKVADWFIYRLSESEWGVMFRDRTVFVTEDWDEALGFYRAHRKASPGELLGVAS